MELTAGATYLDQFNSSGRKITTVNKEVWVAETGRKKPTQQLGHKLHHVSSLCRVAKSNDKDHSSKSTVPISHNIPHSGQNFVTLVLLGHVDMANTKFIKPSVRK